MAGPETTKYGYDQADRLLGVGYGDGSAVLYKLAGDGTRKGEKKFSAYIGDLTGYDSAINPDENLTYWYNQSGGLDRILNNNIEIAKYVTDPAGRLESEVRPGSEFERRYHWDGDGRLAKITITNNGVSQESSYLYDHSGLRISKAANGVTTRYLWGADGLVEEGNFQYERVNGIVTGVGGERIVHDGLGSVAGRIGAGGLNTYRIDAWGGFRNGTGPGLEDPSLGFAGMHAEAGVGLSYAQQRWYDERTGRFLSEDPVFGDLGNPMSLHRWVYAYGNPTRFIDPLGMAAFNRWELEAKPIEELRVLAKIDPGARIFSDENFAKLDSKILIAFICSEDRCNNNKPSVFARAYSGVKDWIFGVDDRANEIAREKGAELIADLGINPNARNRWKQVPGDSTPQSEGPSFYATREEIGAESGELLYKKARDVALFEGAGVVAGPLAGSLKVVGKKTVAARGVSRVASQGFRSFDAFKRAMGPAGEGMHWHHIVEKAGNVKRFGAETIHNTSNLMRLDVATHQRVSGLYSSIRPAITGSDSLTVRQWLSGQSFEAQRAFGLQAIEKVRAGLW
jgi:RHS repeat-associated protein